MGSNTLLIISLLGCRVTVSVLPSTVRLLPSSYYYTIFTINHRIGLAITCKTSHMLTAKESTSIAAPLDNVYNLIGSLKITCKMIDSSYQLSDHDVYQLDQVSALTKSDRR